MTHIPSNVLQQLKQMLLEKKAKLLAIQKEADEENPKNDVSRLDDNASSDTDAREEVQMLQSEAVNSQVIESLVSVETALDRIEKGTYGITADGKTIPVERLFVDPSATTLVQ